MSLVRSWCAPQWAALITAPRCSTRMGSSAGRWASSAQPTSRGNPNRWIPGPITTAHYGQDFPKAAAAEGIWPSMRRWFAEEARGGMVVLGNHPIIVRLSLLPPRHMASHKNPLSNLTHEFGAHVIDEDSGMEVFDAPTSHALIQAAGYLKYNLAKTTGQGVFFRGQAKLYKTLSPTLLRGIRDGPQKIKRCKLLKEMLDTINAEDLGLRSVAKECREPLLQHYGVRTTWLDVVDNIWIALWFACHSARAFGWPEEYLHFEKRIPDPRGAQEYACVLLLASAYSNPISGQPGLFRADRSETIDLRTAEPSHFVRPHAQHGLLVRRLSRTGLPVCDQRPLLVGTIRVRLEAALDWLGDAATLTPHSLFPPAFYDYGYRELLSRVKPIHKELGSIHRMQA